MRKTPRKPVNRERALEVIRARYGSIAIDTEIAEAEWYDFGRVNGRDLLAAAKNAGDFVKAGVFFPPQPICIFRARIHDAHMPAETEVVMIIHQTQADVANAAFFMFYEEGDKLDAMPAPENIKTAVMSVYAGLWMVLNTRGVEVTSVEPSPKLNRAREKAGKAPLRRVTYVNVARYVEAERETERMASKGERSSPRPHIRRGHVRRFKASGRTIWIMPMIVNGSEATRRSHYVVRQGQAARL